MDQDSDFSYEEQDAAVISPPRIKTERPSNEVAETDLSTGYEGHREPDSEESDYVEEDDDENALSAAESQDLRSPLKRPLDDTIAVYRPFKRQRSELNLGYLELLNKEIQDAAQQSSFGDLELPTAGEIGLTPWSAAEKLKFFEAVARLGKHDLPGIATKIGSKSIAEVSHYLHHLQEASDLRQQHGSRSILEFAEYPAAVEISQQCCHAQEEAADEISLKQEAREELREQNRWGDDANSAGVPQFAQLFHASKWLELSARMFMNSSVPGNNWNSVNEEPPSMWATTFDDFHSLAISVTRRLVQTTLFMAMSRIRAKNAMGSKVREMVQLQDAEAAISSLNMAGESNEAWIKSARRLRLDVYEDPPEGDEELDEERMTYEEVEQALSGEGAAGPQQQAQPDTPFSTQHSDEDEEDGSPDNLSDSSRSPSPTNVEEQEIDMETMEILEYSERQAEEIDQYASYKAEVEMWNVLQKKPPMELPKMQDPGPPRRSNQSLDNFYPSGRDWARKLLYYSEWETLPQPEPEPESRLKEEEMVVEEEAGDEGGDEAEEEAEEGSQGIDEDEGGEEQDEDEDEEESDA
ncbi:hypothetical protein TrVGV298_001673 [Trichoderma virens]|nr:hypothetical protein TrVGV298_001673 [Trichoderma virens]